MLNMDPSREIVGYLIRHGELKNMKIWDGQGDFSLSEKGEEQAAKAANWLSFQKIGRAIASDVPRAVQTAQYLMDTGAVVCPYLACDPNLRPWNVAGFTGKEKTPERVAEFKKYVENPDLVIPEGESRRQLDERVKVVFEYLGTPYDAKPTAIFIHNSVIKAILGIDDVKDACSPGGIIACWMDEKGQISFEIVLGKVELEEGVS